MINQWKVLVEEDDRF